MPAVLRKTRKIVHTSYHYRYQIDDLDYEGSYSQIETRDATFDGRRHLKRMKDQGPITISVFYLENAPSVSRVSPPNQRRAGWITLASALLAILSFLCLALAP